jgi:hypothetical protein
MATDGPEDHTPTVDRARQGFQKILSSHGFGFQYAVQAHLNQLAEVGPASWQFEASEFPVRVGTRETRIDFVYRSPPGLAYLVGECKRVNPGVSWGFIRASERRQRYDASELLVEAVESPFQGRVRAVTLPFRQYARFADIGRELKGGADSPEGKGVGRSAIEDAVTQVLAGASGLSRVISENHDRLPPGRPIPILPVIFTTARLWYSEAYLSSAALPTGSLALDGAGFDEVPWLPLQYHQSESLVSEVPREQVMTALADRLHQLHRRAVFIVNVQGIESFIDWSLTAQG